MSVAPTGGSGRGCTGSGAGGGGGGGGGGAITGGGAFSPQAAKAATLARTQNLLNLRMVNLISFYGRPCATKKAGVPSDTPASVLSRPSDRRGSVENSLPPRATA
ncbi:hypothetical protein EOE18_00470 [Novosphingobium umbonatum]|uniref:Uncharacterized protein n=1 Tax=Novosphingobium umbonatum TaxID=1908524 RepID=A0A3S2UUU2_9SPHN|nr:hypothetical protein EOE18_00470 [Novosphingobium umbonatum]